MGLTRFVLKRPVTTVLMVLCLIVFGFRAVANSRMELLPPMDLPMLIVNTPYPGASPEDVAELISKKIENEIGSLSGVKSISSTSMEGNSMVITDYDYGTDIDKAYDDLKKKLDALKPDLPGDSEDSVIYEMNMSESAAVTLVVQHDKEENLYDYVKNKVKPEFEKLSSVSSVSMSGGQKGYIQVKLIPEKMRQYKLAMEDVANAVAAANFTLPTGSTHVGNQKLSVSAGVEYDNVERLKKVPILLGGGSVICLEDVADVANALDAVSGIARYNGQDTISLELKKQQSSTAIEVSKQARDAIETLQQNNPGLDISVVNDSSDQIKSSLYDVVQTMIMAIIISMIVIFLFFGEVKASLIVGTSIPISILATLIAMNVMDFTLNVITMSSLVLGVGMMVDNSIVVLESCFRATKDSGFVGYKEAALSGSGVVVQSIIGSTATTCVVFFPLAAMVAGMTGQMFKPLGYTIIFCMTASLLSAMTVVPLCYCMYHPQEKETSPLGYLVERMQNGYRRIMRVILPKRKTVMLVSLGLLAFSIWMASRLRTELMAEDDTGTITVTIQTRPGLKVEAVDQILKEAEYIVTTEKDLKSYLVTFGSSGMASEDGSKNATLTAYLKKDRKKQTDQVVKEWKPLMDQIEGASIKVEAASSMSMTTAANAVEFILQSTQYDELKSASDAITNELLRSPEVRKVTSSLQNAAPVVRLEIDALKANAENLTPMQIASEVNNRIDGIEAKKLEVNGEEVTVEVEYAEVYDDIDELQGIVLTNNAGGAVALTDVADIEFRDSPTAIARKNRQYQVTIKGEISTDKPREKTAIQNRLFEEAVKPHMTANITRGLNDIDKAMADEFSSLFSAIAIAVFLVFVVMACQFESPKFSVMVMTTIPFSLIGSFGLLFVTDVAISMMSLLGFLMLAGTVVNNGILYVDTVNQYRATMEMNVALVEAGATRLRPILMTTLTTIVAMIPMAMAYGESGKSMQGLALVNIGGLVASTVLSLLMLPVYYSLMNRRPGRARIPAAE